VDQAARCDRLVVEGAVWQDTLITGGKMSTSGKAVKDAIAIVERQIGLDAAPAQGGLAA
jgi:hypothetical protein